MENRNGNLRTLILMIAAALFVVAVIGIVSLLDSRESDHHAIVLPPEDWQNQETDSTVGEGFVTVTPENAPVITLNLERPSCYHQSLQQTTEYKTITSVQTTDVWACNGVQKIITSADGQTRHILTDGEIAYLWYRDETWNVESFALPDGVGVDDLSGVLSYETISGMKTSEIIEAAYVTLLEQENAPCLYVSAENDAGVVTNYWVDLASGLLAQAECRLGDDSAYRLEQTGLSVLDRTDEALLMQMCLPDGTTPFATAAVGMPQE